MGLANKLLNMRMERGITSKALAQACGISPSTMSRYENGRFSMELIDLDILQNLALCCGKDKLFLFDEFLLFRLHRVEILTDYLSRNGVSKQELARQVGVSYTLVKNWFGEKNRCPSYEVWEGAFREFTLEWIEKNS